MKYQARLLLSFIFFELSFQRENGAYFAREYADSRVTETNERTTVASLTQCALRCLWCCHGFNFDGRNCELFDETQFNGKTVQEGHVGWHVYVSQNVSKGNVRASNSCLNGGSCIMVGASDFKCKCPKYFIGKNCERDIGFEIQIEEKNRGHHVTAELPYKLAMSSFSLCITYNIAPGNNSYLETVFNYGFQHSFTTENCSLISIVANKTLCVVKVFGLNVTSNHESDHPVSVCITKSIVGQVKVYFKIKSAITEKNLTQLLPKDLPGDGLLTFGETRNPTLSYFLIPKLYGCTILSNDVNQSFVGNILTFFMYKGIIDVQSLLQGREQWPVNDDLLVSWDYFRNPKFHSKVKLVELHL